MPSFGRGQSVAHPCKGARIPRGSREAPNPPCLPGAGEGSSDLAAPFHPSGDRSPGAPDGAGRCGGPPVHRRARHQQATWWPAGARVFRLRPTSWPVRRRCARSGRKDVSRRRAERRLRSMGRCARQLAPRPSCSPKPIRPLAFGIGARRVQRWSVPQRSAGRNSCQRPTRTWRRLKRYGRLKKLASKRRARMMLGRVPGVV